MSTCRWAARRCASRFSSRCTPRPTRQYKLQISGIGRLRTRVVRSMIDGVAVEFNIDPYKEAHLLAALQQVLSDYPFDE